MPSDFQIAFSTMTSYTGFGISLKDSYADLPNQKRRLLSAAALTSLVVVPPLALAFLHPGAFLHTLDIAGTFGGGLFVEILPMLILLKVRRAGSAGEFKTKGGSLIPFLVLFA